MYANEMIFSLKGISIVFQGYSCIHCIIVFKMNEDHQQFELNSLEMY